MAYSFNKREYVLWEFPKHYIAFKYTYDVMSPMDKYLATDKDNLFVGWKWTTVDQMSYMRDATLTYELETNTGFSVRPWHATATTSLRGNCNTGRTTEKHPDSGMKKNTLVHDITTTELGVTLRYAPGETSSTPNSAACPYRWMRPPSPSPTPPDSRACWVESTTST